MPLLNKAGRFDARVKHADQWIGESGTGTVYVGLPLEIISDGECKGQHITGYLYINDNTLDRTIETLAECFGFDGDLEGLYQGTKSLEGYECSIVTEIETYNGEARCKVKWINPLGGGNGIKPVEQDKFKSILSRLGGKAKAVAQNKLKDMGTRPQPVAPAPQGAATGTDDLPF